MGEVQATARMTASQKESLMTICSLIGRAFLPILVLVGMAAFGCGQGELKTPPDYLLGIWRTNAVSHTGDTLEIRSDRLLLGKGEEGEEVSRVYMITKIQETVENEQKLYSITYRDLELAVYDLTFFYDPKNGGMITFKNQSHLQWTRTGSRT